MGGKELIIRLAKSSWSWSWDLSLAINPDRKEEEPEDKSLQGLVCLARKEMEEENIQKKVCTTIMTCA